MAVDRIYEPSEPVATAPQGVVDERPREPVVTSASNHGLSALHLALGAFPLAYFLVALITDYTYSQSGNILWSNMAAWMIFAGLVSGGIAVALGLLEWLLNRGHRSTAHHRTAWHAWITILALVIGVIDAMVHARDGWTSVVPTGLTLTLIVFVLLLIGSLLPAFQSDRREVRA